VISRDRKDNDSWSCWYISLGRFLRVHWHAGLLPDSPAGTPWFRLRSIEVCGWKMPCKYHVI
jgi:hypothetical protein